VKTVRARLFATAIAVGAAVVIAATGSAAMAGGDSHSRNFLHERLSGYQEDPLALSTAGSADFRAQINVQGQTITYRLSYQNLSSPVTQAHIHFGGKAQSGGIIVFFCSNLPNPPAGTQACPPAPATITGTLRPADVIGPAGQGIAAGEWGEFISAIRAGSTYANVHSMSFPGGEIRAQINN
jgi:hypothetical protein